MNSPLTPPIRWPAEALWEAVVPTLPGFTVEVLPEIDSTNSELMRRLKGRPGQPPQPGPRCWWPAAKRRTRTTGPQLAKPARRQLDVFAQPAAAAG